MPCFVTRNFLNLFFSCIEIFPFFRCKCCMSKSKVLALALKLRAPEKYGGVCGCSTNNYVNEHVHYNHSKGNNS